MQLLPRHYLGVLAIVTPRPAARQLPEGGVTDRHKLVTIA
jgi:hypothetical protein